MVLFHNFSGFTLGAAVVLMVTTGFGATTAVRAEPVQVEQLLPPEGGLIPAYDANGIPVADLPVSAFPAVPFEALDHDPDNDVVAVPTSSHGTVWLAPTSVTLSKRAGIMTDCEAVTRLGAHRSSDGKAKGVSRGLASCDAPAPDAQ